MRIAGVEDHHVYIGHGFSGSRARRSALDRAPAELEPGHTCVVTTLDRLVRSTINVLGLASTLRNVKLRVLNLDGGLVDTGAVTGRVILTLMAALAEMEIEVDEEPINNSARKRRETGSKLGRRPQVSTDAQVADARGRLHAGTACTRLLAEELGMSEDVFYWRVAQLPG